MNVTNINGRPILEPLKTYTGTGIKITISSRKLSVQSVTFQTKQILVIYIHA